MFAPEVEEANGTCILLKRLVLDVNTGYRSRGFGSPQDTEARKAQRHALAALIDSLSRSDP